MTSIKLEKASSVFNLGDTSFRRKTILDDFKIILPILQNHKVNFPRWENSNESQGVFYNTVLNNTDLFVRNQAEDPAKRARTLTNALIKPGLVNFNRELGESAVHWISNKTKKADSLEILFTLAIDNLVFFRQLLKLRVYDATGNHSIYPFRIALNFLSKYQDVPEGDLLTILHSIEPTMTHEEIDEIINNYENVTKNQQIFEEFIELNLPTKRMQEDIFNAQKLFGLSKLSEETIFKMFPNRKSKIAQQKYYEFYSAVFEYRHEKSINNLEKMLDVSRDSKIKKSFGFNSLPFKIPRKVKLNVEEFEESNSNSLLLDIDSRLFLAQFYNSKRSDLIREYSDMTKRIFNLTGVLSFENGLINLIHPWLIKKVTRVISEMKGFSERGTYQSYEENINSVFFKDLTISEILGIAQPEIEQIKREIMKEYHVETVHDLQLVVEAEKEERFRTMIDKDFPKSKIVSLLKLFSDRTQKNDKKIQKQVSDAATVPTIFEYIVAIAWYHLSNKDYSIRGSLNLALDGDLRPLTHATGGDGDIIIHKEKHILMLEVTLMDKNAQKRGEMEPVIRHTTNLSIREQKKVLTIFIADELDNNVMNIFRASSMVELESTQERGKRIKGVSIFSMRINEIIQLIESNTCENDVIEVLNEEFNRKITHVNTPWRKEALTKLGIDNI